MISDSPHCAHPFSRQAEHLTAGPPEGHPLLRVRVYGLPVLRLREHSFGIFSQTVPAHTDGVYVHIEVRNTENADRSTHAGGLRPRWNLTDYRRAEIVGTDSDLYGVTVKTNKSLSNGAGKIFAHSDCASFNSGSACKARTMRGMRFATRSRWSQLMRRPARQQRNRHISHRFQLRRRCTRDAVPVRVGL